MMVVGVCVRVEVEGRPTARAIQLDDSTGAPVMVEKFEFTGDDVEFAQQLLDLSKSIASTVRGIGPNRVVIRRADFPPAASRKDGPKLRLLAEGRYLCSGPRAHPGHASGYRRRHRLLGWARKGCRGG